MCVFCGRGVCVFVLVVVLYRCVAFVFLFVVLCCVVYALFCLLVWYVCVSLCAQVEKTWNLLPDMC